MPNFFLKIFVKELEKKKCCFDFNFGSSKFIGFPILRHFSVRLYFLVLSYEYNCTNKKKVHETNKKTTKILIYVLVSPKRVNPRDKAGNAEEEMFLCNTQPENYWPAQAR